ncbi:MAG TPA: hypothetical protein VLF93_02965 [Candidatus Saccharimonadales bacterium]|nr:hypothetical protein [Candidatus Saccharimonadales bacterium]
MIANLNKKDIVAIVYITLLSVIAVVYALSIIPSPNTEQIIARDHKRIADLGDIKSAVDYYYQQNNILPPSLAELTTQAYSPSTSLEKNDPKTHEPYEYTVTSSYSYSLCATFETDSTKEQPNSYDTTAEDYSIYDNQFNHGIGHSCFTEKEPPLYDQSFPIAHPTIFPCNEKGRMCPMMTTENTSASPSAILSSFNDNGNCAWTPTFYLKGFAPYSQIRVYANETLASQCTKKPNQKMTASTTLNQETSANGDVLLGYPEQLTYGEFTYTFTDDQGKSASVNVSYDGKSLRPTVIPSQ